jgi:hypothetical protein
MKDTIDPFHLLVIDDETNLLVARLRELRADYRERGRRFYALPAGTPS